jgi:hypothetical protein
MPRAVGPLGSVWGQLRGDQAGTEQPSGAARTGRPPTDQGWAWQTAQVRQQPWSANNQIHVLVKGGPSVRLQTVTEPSPGRLRLDASTTATAFEPGHPSGGRSLALVRGQAEQVNAGYGPDRQLPFHLRCGSQR